ncbi:hypothetical protein HDU87_006614 [Geranomyces variabilis]|uniref:RRM domain-containing protein n=1 Tax=Geranomyces variabilis TaxID=109894 RepID=A0AAD5XKY4_9FUNG|nr:hypothetical protein HDU87_006614 [Geranomyces variabilis]
MASGTPSGSQNTKNGRPSNGGGVSRSPVKFVGFAHRLESAATGVATQGATAPLNPMPTSTQNQPVSGRVAKPATGDNPVGPDNQVKVRDLYPTEDPTAMLRISNLPPTSPESRWRNFCKQHGKVVNFRWAEDHCFVEFTTASAASKVIAGYGGMPIDNSVIKIEFMKAGSPPKVTPQDRPQEAEHTSAPAETAPTGTAAAPETAATGTAAIVTHDTERQPHAGDSEQAHNEAVSTKNSAQIAVSESKRRSPAAARSTETTNVQQPSEPRTSPAPSIQASTIVQKVSADSKNSPAASSHSAPARFGTPASNSTPDTWTALKAARKQHANHFYGYPGGLDPKTARRVAEYHANIVPPPADDGERRSSSPDSSPTYGINCLGDNKGGWGKPSATGEGYFGNLNNISPHKRTAQGDPGHLSKVGTGQPNDDGAITLADGRKKQKTKENRPDDNRAPIAWTADGQWSSLVWKGVLLLTSKQDENFSLGQVCLLSKSYTPTELQFGDTLPFTLHEDLIFRMQQILDSPQAEIFLVTSTDGQCLGLPFVGEQNMLQVGLWNWQDDEIDIQLYLVPGAAFSEPPISVAAWERESPDNDLQNSLVAAYLVKNPSGSRGSTTPGERWKLDKTFAPDHWMQADVRLPVPTSRITPAISSQRSQATEGRTGPAGLFPDMSDLYHIEDHVERGQPFLIFRPVNPHISATELLLRPEKFFVKEEFGYTTLPQWTEKLLASRVKTEAQEAVAGPHVQQSIGTSPAIALAAEQLELASTGSGEVASNPSDAVNLAAPAQQQVPPATEAPAATIRSHEGSPYAHHVGSRLVPMTARSRYCHPNRQLRVAPPTPPAKPSQPVKQQVIAAYKRQMEDLAAKISELRNVNAE